MDDLEFDKKLREAANKTIAHYSANEDQKARVSMAEISSMLSSRNTRLPHDSELILASLWKIAQSLELREICLQFDEIMSSMMGEGMIEYDWTSRAELLEVMPGIIAQSEGCSGYREKDALQGAIAKLIGGREWHRHETEHVTDLYQIAMQHGFDSLKEPLLELRGYLQTQNAKVDLFSSDGDERALYWPCIDYPLIVTVETFMKCNARCNFCPYPMMEDQGLRAGQKMSQSLFEKIINDLKDIPPELGFTLNLSRVNEPLLDTRIYDFLKIVDDELPGCHAWLPSNGSTLTEKNIRKLSDIKCFETLGISINSNDPEEYEQIMGLPFERTKKNVDRLHEMLVAGEINFKVRLTHVRATGRKSKEVTEWFEERWPAFDTANYIPTDWLGITSNEIPGQPAPVTPCMDWYQVHILADGSEALCCFDALGKYATGNARDQHILEMYNVAWQRKARKYLVARQSEVVPGICHGCPIR